MLPPVFYVQQLEQILLRKLLSPPTPAARPLRPRAACLYPYSVFSFAFFARFFVSSHIPLVSCVCVVRRCLFLHPVPVLPAASALISIFSFLFSFLVPSHVPLVLRVCAARPTHLHQYSVFVSPFHFRPRPFGSAFVIFCFLVFPFFFDPYFRRFYDLFLRRKYLESLVRVIRPFGVRPRATKAKKFPA